MRISDRYIGSQILTGTVFAIILLTLLLVVGNLFKEIRPILVEYGAPLSVLGTFTLSVIPVSLIFTVPWAFLCAVLLVFGRLSGGNELNAFRSAGLSLTRLSAPVFVLGALLSALCLWLNIGVAPLAERRVRNLITNTVLADPRTLLRAGADQSRLQNVKIDAQSNGSTIFENFHLFMMDGDDEDGAQGGAYVHGRTAEAVIDRENKRIGLRLTDAYAEGTSPDGRQYYLMPEELEWIFVDYSDSGKNKVKPGSMKNAEIDAYLASPEFAELDQEKRAKRAAEFRSTKVRRYTSSFACLAFAFVGVPLGIKARRRDTSSGLVISIALGAAYFGATAVLGSGPLWTLWLPNVLCIFLGLILFRRARFR